MKRAYKRLVSDTMVFAVGNMLTKLMQFLLLPMYTALLSTEQYGIGELVNNMSELLYPLCCLGIYEGVFRYSIDRDSDPRKVLSTGVSVAFALAPVVAVVGIAGYAFTGFDYTWYLVTLCLVTSFKTVCMQFAKGLGKTKLYAASGVISTLVLCGAGYLLLGVLRAGITGYLLALILCQATQLLLVTIGARMWRYFSLGSIDGDLMRRLLRYSIPMVPNALAWWFVNLSGRYIVLFSSGIAVAGLYTAASKLPAVMNMLVSVFQQAWQIFSAREYSAADRSRSFSIVFRVYSALLLCAGSLAIAVTEPLSRVMLSSGFYEARLFVPLLMFGAVVNGYSTYFGVLYNAAKQNRMIFVTTVVGALSNVVLSVLLATEIGVWGPIVGSVVAYSIISISRAFDTRKFVRIEMDLPYQVVGLSVLLAEVALLSIGIVHATTISLGLSVALVAFTIVRYRGLLGGATAIFKRKG